MIGFFKWALMNKILPKVFVNTDRVYLWMLAIYIKINMYLSNYCYLFCS